MEGSRKKRSLVLAAAMFSLCLGAWPGFADAPAFEVVSSVPMETDISRAGTRDAAAVWLEMVGGARSSLDLAEFYLSGEKGEALEPVVEAVLAAGRRGVKVRLLCDASMAAAYPGTLRRLRGQPGILARLFDWKELTGGILHAKYFIVDGREAFVGSQNFDWRSLSHIQETGLRIRSPLFAGALERIFAADWDYSGGDRAAYRRLSALPPLDFPADARLVASPALFNPPGVGDALAELVALIDGARRRIAVQLLSYGLEIRGSGEKFTAIDRALRRAAGRGVTVRLLVSDWNLRQPGLGSWRHSPGRPRLHPLCPRHSLQGHARRRRRLLGGDEQLGPRILFQVAQRRGRPEASGYSPHPR
jgi:phosphatidylserine/phosphatidylglycerophosphate/cardiolipin synthase-like enzyme